MTREQAETWITFLIEESGYGANSVQGYFVAARLFCKKLVSDDVLDQDPFAQIQNVPAPTMPDIKISKPSRP